MAGDGQPSGGEGASRSDGQQPPASWKFVVKNPSRPSQDSFSLELSLDLNIAQVKQQLQQNYPGNPEPAQQTVIYAGKVLRDDATVLRDVIKQEYTPDVPFTLHLVVKDAPGSSLPPRPAAAAAAQPVSRSQSTTQPAESQQEVPLAGDPGTAASGAGAGTNAGVPLAYDPYVHAQQQPGLGPYSSPYGGVFPPPAAAAAWDTSAFPAPWHPVGHPPQGYTMAAYSSPYLIAGNMAVMQQMYAAALAAYQCAAEAAGDPQQPHAAQPGAAAAAAAQHANVFAPVAVLPWGLAPTLPVPAPNAAMLPQQAGQQQGAAAAVGMPHVHPLAQLQFGAYPYPPPPPPPYGYPHPWAAAHHPGLGAAAGVHYPGQPLPGMVLPPGAQAVLQQGNVQRNGRPVVRVRLLRINVRMLLQLLVLGLIIWSHCPPGRFIMLLLGGLLLYLTTLTPLRRLLNRLVGLPHHLQGQPQQQQQQPAGAGDGRGGQGQPGGVAVAGQPQAGVNGAAAPAAAAGPGARPGQAGAVAPAGDQQPGAVGNAAVPGAAGAAGQRQQPIAQRQPPGLLRELQALIMGFFTSLLPGWNYNPEDAAAFAAAQELVAREEQAAQRAAGAVPAREHQD